MTGKQARAMGYEERRWRVRTSAVAREEMAKDGGNRSRRPGARLRDCVAYDLREWQARMKLNPNAMGEPAIEECVN